MNRRGAWLFQTKNARSEENEMALSMSVVNAIANLPSSLADEPPEKWCSTGLGSPAEFSREAKGRGGWLLTIAGKSDEWLDDESGELTTSDLIVWWKTRHSPNNSSGSFAIVYSGHTND